MQLVLKSVNQHAKITREELESTLKSFQLVNEKIRYLSGETWSDRYGANSRNQAMLFYK